MEMKFIVVKNKAYSQNETPYHLQKEVKEEQKSAPQSDTQSELNGEELLRDVGLFIIRKTFMFAKRVLGLE